MVSNREIERQMRAERKKLDNSAKLLLLGPASSGKSTVFKQAIAMYGKGFAESDRRQYVPLIHHTMVTAIRTLIIHANQYGALSPSLTPHRVLLDNVSDEQLLNADLATAIDIVWHDELIQRCWYHHTLFHLPEAVSYFMDRLYQVTAPNYIPTLSDILRVRAPTSGIVETTFATNDGEITIVDVGGQRSERRKWINCFECVKAVIFVAAISEYDQQLEEDPSQNRLVESFELFDQIVNSKYFSETSMVLFLNKSDLFKDKLRRVPFSSIFHKYKGPNEYEEVIAWLQNKFESRNQDANKKIFVHVTCAINSDNFRLVFETVKDTLRRELLKRLDLI